MLPSQTLPILQCLVASQTLSHMEPHTASQNTRYHTQRCKVTSTHMPTLSRPDSESMATISHGLDSPSHPTTPDAHPAFPAQPNGSGCFTSWQVSSNMMSYLSKSSWTKNITSVRTRQPEWLEHSNSRGWMLETSSGSLSRRGALRGAVWTTLALGMGALPTSGKAASLRQEPLAFL